MLGRLHKQKCIFKKFYELYQVVRLRAMTSNCIELVIKIGAMTYFHGRRQGEGYALLEFY